MPAAGTTFGAEDADEVVSAMQGDERARSALWQSHRRWLAAVLLSHKPREVEVEDLMQEVAVKFVSKLDTLRDPQAFRPWLRQIAINAAREAARSLRREREERKTFDPAMVEHSERGGTSGANAAAIRDEAEELLEYAQTLPPEFREPVLLRCVKGMSCRQIAALLDLPITTIETRLSRGRRMLRDEWLRKTTNSDGVAAREGAARYDG